MQLSTGTAEHGTVHTFSYSSSTQDWMRHGSMLVNSATCCQKKMYWKVILGYLKTCDKIWAESCIQVNKILKVDTRKLQFVYIALNRRRKMYYQTYFRDYNSLLIKRDDSFWNEVQNNTGSHRDVHNLQTAHPNITTLCSEKKNETRMWANAQRDGRPAEYRWRPLFNAAKFGWCPLLECCAVTLPRRESRWNLQKAVEICRGAPNSPTDLSR